MGLMDDLWSGAGGTVDKGFSTVVGAGSVLGGLTLVASSETAKLINDAALSLDFKTEEEHADAEVILDQTAEFGKGAAVGGTMQLVDVVTTPIELDKHEDSEGFWDLFFGDTAEGLGTTLTTGTIMADAEREGKMPSTEDIASRREAIASWEDEILMGVFAGVPLLMIPQLRILLAAATPVAFSAISNAIQTGSGIANDILQTIMVGLDLVFDGEDETVEQVETEPETSIVEEEIEVQDAEEELVIPSESELEEEVEVKTFHSSEGLEQHNEFVEREIFY